MEKNLKRILALLKKAYPDPRTTLHSENPFQLLIAAILSAQTTDSLVNRITPALFRKFRQPEDFARTPVEEIMDAISSVNFYRNKARNIKKLSEVLSTAHGGTCPDTMEALVQLPGVARKTANVVLSQAFGKAEGIVVDTHVSRVAQKLGITRNTDPEKIEQDLMHVIPRSEWISFPFRLVLHGRGICRAKAPDCPGCVLNKLCAHALA